MARRNRLLKLGPKNISESLKLGQLNLGGNSWKIVAGGREVLTVFFSVEVYFHGSLNFKVQI